MKKFIPLFIFLSIFLIAVGFKFDTENSFPLFGRVFVLDPGHGNEDPGSVYNNQYEKDYNLIFSQSLKVELERLGATVLMTREGDYDLSNPNNSHRKKSDFDNRITFIENAQPDMYISLHLNYLKENKYFGAQCFYDDIISENKRIAEMMQKNVNKFYNYDKEAKKIGDDKYMYKRLKVKGVLLEYGFISNPKDRYNLMNEDYRMELAKVISNSLIEYFT